MKIEMIQLRKSLFLTILIKHFILSIISESILVDLLNFFESLHP